ncbi:ABC transporter permease [Paenibacillus spongiae]|uniref:ABC transporter permease n=1 Tax=Paenibacillus spongiae TaxID=2909671 RepID=A0ABY5SI51_9BACL|nr:ABC transporter permease [Paenibacillus spongiae]UVI33424.1 ABC transporter permease [Paenibacillus spongiae]
MNNLVRSELFKLSKDRSFWSMFVILIAAAVSYPMLVYFVLNIESVSIKELYTAVALEGANTYIVKFVPCILAGFFISSEYSIGTMKSIAASGNSRMRIYLAKLMGFAIGAVIISLTFPIVMPAVGTLFYGINDMPGLDYIVQTIGLTILYALAFASIMALAAISFTDSGKTIGFLILFFSLFDSILYMLSQKFIVIETIYHYSVSRLLLDIGKFNLGNGELLKLWLVPIITFIVFGLIGSFVFQRKEIK